MTPSAAASANTRVQAAVSSSSARLSSWSGLEQYGQPSGQRWVSSASRPSGRGSVSACCARGKVSVSATSQLQKLLIGERAQQRRHVGQHPLARRIVGGHELVDDLPECLLSGAVLKD